MKMPPRDGAEHHVRLLDPSGQRARFQGFQDLMQFNINDILLVSSLYDSYILVEDGRLYESLRSEKEGLNLVRSPAITHVPSGQEALSLVAAGRRFDLVIATLHIEDLHAARFAALARESGLNTPIVLLTYDNREQSEVGVCHERSPFDKIFMWQGDFRMLLAIVKWAEDKANVEHDVGIGGVQVILLIEDDIRSYSSFLPLLYTEVLKQSQRLIAEGVNLFDKYLRVRARPKILLCTTFEEAWCAYEQYADNVSGIIAAVDLIRNNVPELSAGISLVRRVKARHPDIPILLASAAPASERAAHAVGASFLLKDSPTMLRDLRQFMTRYFSFGSFIFRMPDGTEVGRAADLKSLEEQLRAVPIESIVYHAERNHFSHWLKVRTEFLLAHKLRPRKVTDFAAPELLRQDLISSLEEYRRSRHRGELLDFDRATFDPLSSFARIGEGSLGGKARGLSFVNTLVNTLDIRHRFDGVEIAIPPAVVLRTGVFDQFMQANDLQAVALHSNDDAEITRRFVRARKFPRVARAQLREFLDLVREPLAVRSSSLLEDSQYHPFAGVYATYMIPNNHPDPAVRLNQLLAAIKRVYASTYSTAAKNYIAPTAYRLEEEKMAVIVQKIMGAVHESRFYPDFSGVARSYNFYPFGPQKPQDGIVSVALGLGKIIVGGGTTLRFCPRYPKHILQFASVEETLRNSQKEFYALDMRGAVIPDDEREDLLVRRHDLRVAEADGSLRYVGSTYSPENETISDGLRGSGSRIVTFAPILRNMIFPLPEITALLLDVGSRGMGTAVELEFAGRLSVPRDSRKDFALLQIRPLVLAGESDGVDLEEQPDALLLCRSDNALGNGVMRHIFDVVVVDYQRFDRAKSGAVAEEVDRWNRQLVAEGRPYILIGVGRWGSLDPWLGIPVRWDQISGAAVIVETSFKDLEVAPSQGSHFFQNITSFMVGYFTVTSDASAGSLDWEWLLGQPAADAAAYTYRLRFATPLVVKIDGRRNRGVILKPAAREAESPTA